MNFINNFIKFISKNFKLTKRQQFVGTILILTIGLIATQLIAIEQRTEMVIVLAIASFIFSVFVLRDDLKGIEYLTLTILPTMFTISVAFFYFLLPVRWLTRLPTAVLYAFCMYAILLTENIYNVAAVRSIQLLRAAHSVGFLITLITAFLLYDTVLAFHLPALSNSLLVFTISFPLILQSLWSMMLEPKLSKEVFAGALVGSLISAQTVYVFSYWPINTTILSLFLTTTFYTITGILRERVVERLFSNTMREFLSVLLITFILVFITTRWGG